MLDDNDMAAAIRDAINTSGRTQREIAEAFGVTVQAVSGWLRTGKMDKRKLPKLAHITGKPLAHFGMIEDPDAHAAPSGYMRFQLLNGSAGMGGGFLNEDYPEIIREVEISATEVRRKLGFLPRQDRVKLITGRGESMSPLIESGDVLMVDTLIDHFAGDGIYLINLGGVTQAKLLQARPDGIHVISANPAYGSYVVPHAEADTLHIGGKIVTTISIKKL